MNLNVNEACKLACKAADKSYSFAYTKQQATLISKFIRQEYRAQLYVYSIVLYGMVWYSHPCQA